MALNPPKKLSIAEGAIEIRRGEGLVRTLDVSNWGSTTPSSASVTIIRQSDESDVTSALIPAGSASISTTTITLPEILTTTTTELGDYIVTVEYEDGTNSPGRPWFKLVVYD